MQRCAFFWWFLTKKREKTAKKRMVAKQFYVNFTNHLTFAPWSLLSFSQEKLLLPADKQVITICFANNFKFSKLLTN